MDASKEFAKTYAAESGMRPFLSFSDMQPHTVKLVKDKKDTMQDTNDSSKIVHGVRFVVLEDSVEKEFFTASIGLIQKLADRNPGEIVTIQMTKTKTDKGFRTGYSVKVAGQEIKTQTEIENEEPEAESDPKW